MEHLDSILKLAGNELAAIEANGKFRSREEIDSVYKLMDIIKDIHCIWEYEDDESEYSNAMRGSYAYRGGSYNDGGSYARGGGRRNARRDSMGRYSRNYRGGGGGYSRADKQDFMENLCEMMEEAPDEQIRQNMQRMIDNMSQQ